MAGEIKKPPIPRPGPTKVPQNKPVPPKPPAPRANPTTKPATKPHTSKSAPPSHRKRRRRRGPSPKSPQPRPGQVTNSTAIPVPAAPKKRGQKRPAGEPRIGVGCIVLRGEEILLVRERGRWSLPKGGLEVGELIQDGARRETFEETGLVVELRELAFIVEFQAKTWGHHLQFFYTGREVSGSLNPRDPDRDVQEARFIPLRQLREFIRFRPRLVALETWLRERTPRHFVFNLDKEPAMLRKRRRVTNDQRPPRPEPKEETQSAPVRMSFPPEPHDELDEE